MTSECGTTSLAEEPLGGLDVDGNPAVCLVLYRCIRETAHEYLDGRHFGVPAYHPTGKSRLWTDPKDEEPTAVWTDAAATEPTDAAAE